ncbi:MAG TPA: LuxR C-terminal-related transcriptional regulator [Conexibacter sp.]|nr:LuxR C-terminal-related transcriptional regulator [Conexibacter sp.]
MAHATDSSSAHTIATKLSPPTPPVSLLPRRRLFTRLAHGTANGTTLVCAPAGSGKTALVASWLRSSAAVTWPVAWLSLDRRDDSRRVFWGGVLAALARADPGDAELAALRLPPRGRIDGLFTALVELLAARTRELMLVLDDLQELRDPAIEEDLTALLRHAPAALRLVLIARAEPSLGLQRLRVSGRLSEIRADDLAFDADEAQALLQRWGARLDAVDARELWRRSGGWAAGLVLPALALREHGGDAAAFVAGYGGHDRAVADFIRTELLAELSGDVRGFLLRTSVADSLPVALAVELGGRPDAAELLERLAHGNALVERDGRRDSYRYGPLFAGLLRSELAHTAPEELEELHGRAARWQRDAGDTRAAIVHGLAAGASQLVAELVAEQWPRLLLDGELALLDEAAEQLPPQQREAAPELLLARAAARAAAGDEGAAALLLAQSDAARQAHQAGGPARDSDASRAQPRPRPAGPARGHAIVELLLGRVRGEVDRTTRAGAILAAAARELARGGPRDDDAATADGLRVLALAQLGAVEVWRGRLETGEQRLEAALAAARERELDAVALLAQSHLALARALSGRLVCAADAAGEALALAQRRGWEGTPAAATAQATLAAVLLHWERLEEAEHVLVRAERSVRLLGEPPLRAFVALQRIALLAAAGAWDAAVAQLRAAQAELRTWPLSPPLRARFVAFEGLLRAARGEREAADLLLRGACEQKEEQQRRPEPAEALARLRLAAGEPLAACATVAPWLERTGLPRAVAVELWTTEAIAREALDDPAGACAALERALALAEPEGFRHELLAHAPAVRAPLRRAIRVGTAHRSFAGELLELLEQDGERPLTLPEPLSEREEAVLRCLPTMLSNREIAGELYVSVNTVKTHLKHIYRKLDAPDRRTAVRRARELRLLGPAHEQGASLAAPVG